jgi:hypothetical protein
MQSIFKNISSKVLIVTAAFVLTLGLNYLYAWTAPAANPPSGNVSGPINVSLTDQVKKGGLAVGVFTAGNSSILGTLGWGVSSVTSLLNTAQGGSVELGGLNSTKNPTNGATPFIDFHYGTGAAQDYNFRIQNSATNQMSFINSAGKTFVMTAAGGLKFPDGTTQTTAASGSVGVGTPVYSCPSQCNNMLSTSASCTYTTTPVNGGSTQQTAACSLIGHLEP